MTPEQILAIRPIFERNASAMLQDTTLCPDGFRYADNETNAMWEGFLLAAEHFQDTVKLLEMFGKDVKTSEYMEQLRSIRAYSKCFTGAYDKKEPIFVLRAQDNTSHYALAMWIQRNIERLGESHPKIIAAKATLGTFIEHPNRKEPD